MLVSLLYILACAKPVPPAPAPVDTRFTILSINDTYRIEGREESGAGGMARVRTLRRRLEAEGPVLVLHAGDLLYPSLLSRTYDGAQMIDLLGWLDGDPDAFDPLLFATFGNHEFDRRGMEDAALLQQRIAESDFTWVNSNVRFVEEGGRPVIEAGNLVPTALVEIAGAKVGIIGICGDFTSADYIDGYADPVATARAQAAALRRAGAHLVVALTHLDVADDLALLDTLGDAGPDLVVGGHDHVHMLRQASNGRQVVKADADAVSAVVTSVRLDAGGAHISPEIVSLDMAVAPDPQVQARVDAWLRDHERSYCADHGEQAPCLDAVLGRTAVRLEAEEAAIRSRETSLGDWVADLALRHFADQGAQVAFLNSGGLRIDKDIPAGTALTRRHLDELLPYPTKLRLVRIDGATLQAVVEQATDGWPGSGNWLQVAGMAFRHDTAANRVSDLHLLDADGSPVPLAPDQPVLAVTSSFLLGGGDGYAMLEGAEVVAEGPDLRDLIVADLAAAGDVGVAPGPMGRICQSGAPCLLDGG
ncbi:MAG: bifunctional metallophosphatase/5'-nucleotidase [Deltaproteobacteria bacterium]|nr:MAG: bifunctional metallophosphatase/5'-nucleotidase [Deltaproteobacteria bacterium]